MIRDQIYDTNLAGSSLCTAAGEVWRSRPVKAAEDQIERSDRLDVLPPGAAGRSLAGVRARRRQE